MFNRIIIVVPCLFLLTVTVSAEQLPMKWSYNVAATKYWESLPIGTGRFGAMIPGNVDHEVIPFNDETLWTGSPYNPNNPDGVNVLKKIREFALARDWYNATREAWKLSSDPVSVQNYQAMAQLNIRYDNHDPTKANDYKRSLDMDNAIAETDYSIDGVKYSRRVFASYPEQVVVIRLTANQKGKINLTSWLTSLQPSAVTRVENDTVVMEGSTIEKGVEKQRRGIHLSKDYVEYLKSRNPNIDPYRLLPAKMRWQAKTKIVNEGGTISVDGDKLVLKNADAVTLILAVATNWKAWNDISADEKKRCNDYIVNAAKLSYGELLNRHRDDYCPLFAACKINLGDDPAPSETTTQRMDAIRKGAFDPAYQARYFQYGRYLLLAAGRENTLAANNHNIWLNDLSGRWNGRWTLNFNLQEYYWHIDNSNLSRLNESLFTFTEQLAQAGEQTAKELYGCRGWCAHHGVDVWFNTAPTDGNPMWATYPLGGAWIMQQLYDHYNYNPDRKYLQRLYPLLKGAVEFFNDFMVKDTETGYWVTCPSSSPENEFIDEQGRRVSISLGSTGDTEIVRNLLRNFIEAATTLQVDAEIVKRSQEILANLPPYKIGEHGQLQEWLYDFKENDVHHRHLVHLFALYPDDDISLHKSPPEIIDAVKVVLQRRGDFKYMGMFSAWKINMYARLEEPEKAYTLLQKMLTNISVHPQSEDSRITPSMEGNQGVAAITAGMIEMLMQSHSGELSLLPALPVQWKSGSIKGIRARGGYEIDLSWRDNKLTTAFVKSNYDRSCKLRTKQPVKVLCNGKDVETKSQGENVIEFETKTGETYEINSR